MSGDAKRAFFEKIGYTPHAQQWLYHDSKARFRVPVCGRRFGKSTMAGRDLEPHLFTHGKRYWIVGPTYDLAEKEFRVVWDDLIVGQAFGREKQVKKAYNKKQGDMYIQFPWKTRVEVRSADHPEFLVGEALDGAVMSEAAKQKKETWERFIRPSLADKRGWATFPTTPEGQNWLYDVWMLGLDDKYPDFESWRFPSWANSAVYPGGKEDPEILLLKQTTTLEWFEQEIGADFTSFVGKIFPEFDETKHVKGHEFNPAWPNYMAFDWGYTNPMACVEFQVSPKDEIFIWREHYKSYTLLEDYVEQLKNREQPEGYRLDGAFGDAADPEAAAYVSQHLVACLADPEAKTNWRDGIDLIRSFMKDRPYDSLIVVDEYGTPALELPGFYIDPVCMHTVKEFNNYRSKAPVKGQNVPELGQKVSDHTIDAVRYALVHLYRLGVQHHLNEVYTGDYHGRTIIQGSIITKEPPQLPAGRQTPSGGSDLVLSPSAGGYFTRDKVL
jgi:hypothetical protein